MRFIVFVKATKQSEAGSPPSPEMLAAMGKFNQELIDAGVLLDGGGLKASSAGAKVRLAQGKRTVIDGPFTEAKELVAGYWIWQCKSLEEALAWAKRCPDPMPGEDSELEIRPFIDLEADYPEAAAEARRQLDGAKG